MQRWVLLSSLLLLVMTQLLLNLHALEHLSGGDEETCVICLTGGAMAHALVGDVAIALPGFTDDLEISFRSVNIPITLRCSFHPRAPPHNSLTA